MDRDLETQLYAVLSLVEALAFLGLAAWAIGRRGTGPWSTVLAAGAALVGAVLGTLAVAQAEVAFLDSFEIYEAVFFRDHATVVYTALRAVGALLLVTGVVLSRRPRPAPLPGSIYGPPSSH